MFPFIPPENIRKPLVWQCMNTFGFLMFSGGTKGTTGKKWVKQPGLIHCPLTNEPGHRLGNDPGVFSA